MRKETRRTLIYYLDVLNPVNNVLLGRLADITLNGLLILSDTDANRDYSGDFEIKLPSGPPFEGQKMIIQGKIKWIKKDTKLSFSYIGIEISNMDSKLEKMITALINRIGFSDGEKKIRTGLFDPEFY